MIANRHATRLWRALPFAVVRRVPRGLLSAALLAIAIVMLSASPAGAHGGPGAAEPPASNWRSRITAFDSPAAGLSVSIIDAGERIELSNTSNRTVTVIGYENEPYLRVGPEGTFENRRSPATYLNASKAGTAGVPDDVDAQAPPEWRQVSAGNRIAWHDHRAHWMAEIPPTAVRDRPDVEHVVLERWVIPIELDGERIEVVGDLTWVPAPPAWPWFLAMAAFTIAIAAAGLTRRATLVLWVATAALLVSCAIDIVSTWAASTDPAALKAASLITPSLSFAFVIAGLAFLDRRRDEALLLILAGAAGITVFFGWASRGFLTNSQFASALPAFLARATVAIALGVGLGLMGLVAVVQRSKIAALWRDPRDD